MKKILLIEDNAEMRENTAEILTLSNYNVLTAVNGKEGVNIAMQELPDLIICDIMMPVLDGYGVLHMLSKNEKTSGIPFIFLSAKADRMDLRKGMEMGADDYLTKPFDEIELLNAIETRLKKMDLLKKDYSRSEEGLNEFIQHASENEELKKLTESDRESISFKKKETIYKEGAFPKGIFLVTKGKIKTFRRHEAGKEFITGLYKDGDFLGYLPLIEETKYADTAEALEESEVIFIPKEHFFALLFQNAVVSRKFIRIISGNLSEKEDMLVKLAYNSVRKKIAEALLTLHSRYKKEDEPSFSMSISREDLANLAGTATETTIRTLSDFKEEKLISIKGSEITLLNPEKLSRIYQ